jgi:cytochrome c oxidase cbb3-type subunit 1
MIAFGSMYYIMPRLVEREWISSRLIKVHFWCCGIGIAMYWVGLSIGGWMQGTWMNNPDIPFIDIVGRMIPYLWSRSIAGTLMTIGHFVFAILVWKMLRREGEWLVEPTLFISRKEAAAAAAGNTQTTPVQQGASS